MGFYRQLADKVRIMKDLFECVQRLKIADVDDLAKVPLTLLGEVAEVKPTLTAEISALEHEDHLKSEDAI